VALVALMFWLAPKPNVSQANQESVAVPVVQVKPESRIIITRYVKPTHAQ